MIIWQSRAFKNKWILIFKSIPVFWAYMTFWSLRIILHGCSWGIRSFFFCDFIPLQKIFLIDSIIAPQLKCSYNVFSKVFFCYWEKITLLLLAHLHSAFFFLFTEQYGIKLGVIKSVKDITTTRGWYQRGSILEFSMQQKDWLDFIWMWGIMHQNTRRDYFSLCR